MERYINKSCKILVEIEGKKLFFEVKRVLDFNNPHLTFLDRYNNVHTYHKEKIKEVREVAKAKS